MKHPFCGQGLLSSCVLSVAMVWNKPKSSVYRDIIQISMNSEQRFYQESMPYHSRDTMFHDNPASLTRTRQCHQVSDPGTGLWGEEVMGTLAWHVQTCLYQPFQVARFGKEPLCHVCDQDTVHIRGKGFLAVS